MLLVGGAILCMGVWVNRDILYGLAGMWAYAGIMIQQLTPSPGVSIHLWSVAAIIISCMVVLLAMLCIAFDCPTLKQPPCKRLAAGKPSKTTPENTDRNEVELENEYENKYRDVYEDGSENEE